MLEKLELRVEEIERIINKMAETNLKQEKTIHEVDNVTKIIRDIKHDIDMLKLKKRL